MRHAGTVALVLGGLALGCSSTHLGDGDAGASPYDECSAPSDCVVRPASCCGACGAATREDSVAVNRARASDYGDRACGGDPVCPACFSPPDPTLVATCEAGRCVVVDLQLHPSTACATEADCRVRANVCCECGATISPETVVAVSGEGAFSALVCDPMMACPDCAPVYPDTYGAACEAGRCVAVFGEP